MKDLNGIQLTRKELNNAGKPSPVKVVGPDGKVFEEDIGNLSTVSIKLFGYRNKEGLLNVSLDIVKVEEHVPYRMKVAILERLLTMNLALTQSFLSRKKHEK